MYHILLDSPLDSQLRPSIEKPNQTLSRDRAQPMIANVTCAAQTMWPFGSRKYLAQKRDLYNESVTYMMRT